MKYQQIFRFFFCVSNMISKNIDILFFAKTNSKFSMTSQIRRKTLNIFRHAHTYTALPCFSIYKNSQSVAYRWRFYYNFDYYVCVFFLIFTIFNFYELTCCQFFLNIFVLKLYIYIFLILFCFFEFSIFKNKIYKYT